MDVEGTGLTDKDRGIDSGGNGSVDAVPPVLEPQAEAEQTLKQKIGALVDKVRDVNAQLDGQVAAEVSLEGRSTFFFAKPAVTAGGEKIICGVDSINGPINVSGDLASRLLPGGNSFLDLAQASRVTSDDVRNWTHSLRSDDEMMDWAMAFDDSKNTILWDKLHMEKINEARSLRVEKALEVVSKPIDFGFGANKQPEVSGTQFGVAHAVPEDRASMDRESADQAALNAKNILGHSQ